MIPIPARDFNDKFSTFLIPIEDGNRQIFLRWRTEAVLKQNFSLYQETEESFWQFCQSQDDCSLVRKFLDIYQQEETTEREKELAKWHLTAYLEIACYRAASSRFSTFSNFNDLTDDWGYYLHLARCLSNNPEEILRIYRKYQQKEYDLERHFMWEIASKIRDWSYQETGQGKYSPWYSLKKVSESTLKQALLNHGVREKHIERYLVVRSCLFEVYAKSEQGKWISPTINEYQAAANYCNCYHFPIDFQEIQKLIKICIEVLRASPKFIYFETDSNPAFIEGSEPDPLLTIAEDRSREEMQNYVKEINQILTQGWELFKQREPDHETMLLLRYGLGLSQSSTAAQIGVHQTTVREHCLQFQEQLLETVSIWIMDRIGVNLKQIEDVEKYLDNWLKQQYKKTIDSVIMASFNNHLDVGAREILKQIYFEATKDSKKIARQMNLATVELKQKVKGAEDQLLSCLLEWVKNTVGISLEDKLERKKVARLIKGWLGNK
ncbi:MAG: hypothetical protein F6K41_05400 [Symploca sp. SIO3E6]|nr:hypothetical protein [Caldora sp. SIO3E6]